MARKRSRIPDKSARDIPDKQCPYRGPRPPVIRVFVPKPRRPYPLRL